MKKFSFPILTMVLSVLTGCQTAPVATQQETQICPPVETPACPVCKVQVCPRLPEATEQPKNDNSSPDPGLQTIGEREWALVEPGDIILEARIDTGAETSSIHAENIQLIEKDGKR